jgi:hypothetical protein
VRISANFRSVFNRLHAIANVTLGADLNDYLALLNGFQWSYIDDNNGHIGINITKPVQVSIYFPQKTTVDGKPATLSFGASFSGTSVALTVTVSSAGQLVVIDPVVSIDPYANGAQSLFVSLQIILLFVFATLL